MISLSRSRASTSSRRSAGILLLVFVFARCGEDAPSQPEGPPQPEAPFQLWVLPGFGTSPTARYRAYPYDIDPAGHVVGMAESSENSGLFGAALWLAPDGRLASLNADGIVLQVAYGINAIGQVVGVGGCGEMGTACVWENGRLRDLGSLDYDGRSEPLAINDNGDVVGWAQAGPRGSDHAVLWRDGVATDLGTLGGLQSQALDIDNSGRVVGWARTERPDGSPRRAFLWQDGTMMDLGPPGPAESFAFAINDRGQVVGHFAGRASSGRTES
jgi:probable HAF family extracellular repeat protein